MLQLLPVATSAGLATSCCWVFWRDERLSPEVQVVPTLALMRSVYPNRCPKSDPEPCPNCCCCTELRAVSELEDGTALLSPCELCPSSKAHIVGCRSDSCVRA